MSLKDRFSEELRYLHELGNDFAQDNPQLARLLGKGGSDPDVERLMEAFAFLTAKLRLKLEDDLPELTHSRRERPEQRRQTQRNHLRRQ